MQLTLTISVLVAAAPALKPITADDWMPMVRDGASTAARTTCEGWLTRADAQSKAEAHKCLANVELLRGKPFVSLHNDERGGGSIGPGYDPDAAKRAIEHLQQAIALAPQDLSAHKGRLHVLLTIGPFRAFMKALESSIATYNGPDPVAEWLPYGAELFNDDRYEEAIRVWLLIDKRYPGDHRMAGNLCGAYAMLEKDQEAMTWGKKAVKLAPNDPTDNWNLARLYDFMGKLDLADAAYQKALSAMTDETLQQSRCLYAEFVEKKLKNGERACKLQGQGHCPESACSEDSRH